MPGIRSRAIGSAAWLAGLPWRLRPGRGKPLPPDDPRLRRVAVVKPCCMGDVLMSTPAIAALRRALPDSHIAVVVGGWSRPAVAHNPRVSSLIDWPASGGAAKWRDCKALATQLKSGHFSAVLVLDRSPLLNLAPLMAGIPVRAGLDSHNRGIGLTHPVP